MGRPTAWSFIQSVSYYLFPGGVGVFNTWKAHVKDTISFHGFFLTFRLLLVVWSVSTRWWPYHIAITPDAWPNIIVWLQKHDPTWLVGYRSMTQHDWLAPEAWPNMIGWLHEIWRTTISWRLFRLYRDQDVHFWTVVGGAVAGCVNTTVVFVTRVGGEGWVGEDSAYRPTLKDQTNARFEHGIQCVFFLSNWI